MPDWSAVGESVAIEVPATRQALEQSRRWLVRTLIGGTVMAVAAIAAFAVVGWPDDRSDHEPAQVLAQVGVTIVLVLAVMLGVYALTNLRRLGRLRKILTGSPWTPAGPYAVSVVRRGGANQTAYDRTQIRVDRPGATPSRLSGQLSGMRPGWRRGPKDAGPAIWLADPVDDRWAVALDEGAALALVGKPVATNPVLDMLYTEL